MSFSNNPSWRALLFPVGKYFAGIPWSPSNPIIHLFGHSLKTKELINQLSHWASYDFPINETSPDGWIECKAILTQLHQEFLISNYLMTKIAYAILYNGYTYRYYKVNLENFWKSANEQYRDLTRLLKKAEQDTIKTLQVQQPNVREKLIPLHQSGMVGFELMPTFSKLLAANYLFTDLAARVKGLTEEVQTVLQDKGDYNSPQMMTNAEFHDVLAKIADSSTAAGHTPRAGLAIPESDNASQQTIDPVMGMITMTLDDPSDMPTEGEDAEVAESEPENETAEVRPEVQHVKIHKPVKFTPSVRRLRMRQSHEVVILDKNESANEDNEN